MGAKFLCWFLSEGNFEHFHPNKTWSFDPLAFQRIQTYLSKSFYKTIMKERFSFFFQINMISIKKKKNYQNSFTIKVLGGTNIKRFISRLIDHFKCLIHHTFGSKENLTRSEGRSFIHNQMSQMFFCEIFHCLLSAHWEVLWRKWLSLHFSSHCYGMSKDWGIWYFINKTRNLK